MTVYSTPQVRDDRVYRQHTEARFYKRMLWRRDLILCALMIIAAMLMLSVMQKALAETITDWRGVEHEVAVVVTVNPGAKVNVREKANVHSGVIYQTKQGTEFAIYGEEDGWYLVTECSMVRNGTGQKGYGWISKKYLKVKEKGPARQH